MEMLERKDNADKARLQKAKEPLLRLIREFYVREEWISPSPNSAKTNAHAMLKHESEYPFKDDRKGKDDCVDVLRACDREGLLKKETYKKVDRHEAERWALTDKAIELLKWPSIVRDELNG